MHRLGNRPGRVSKEVLVAPRTLRVAAGWTRHRLAAPGRDSSWLKWPSGLCPTHQIPGLPILRHLRQAFRYLGHPHHWSRPSRYRNLCPLPRASTSGADAVQNLHRRAGLFAQCRWARWARPEGRFLPAARWSRAPHSTLARPIPAVQGSPAEGSRCRPAACEWFESSWPCHSSSDDQRPREPLWPDDSPAWDLNMVCDWVRTCSWVRVCVRV
jgi:hypothetical protein